MLAGPLTLIQPSTRWTHCATLGAEAILICRELLSLPGVCGLFDGRTTPSAIGVSQRTDHVWNSLPSKLRQCDTLAELKRLLKTDLFGDHGAL